jgi:arsenate reductase (thioredoxin)
MAQGFLRSFDKKIVIRSAGTEPDSMVNQKAVIVMKESGIDISNHIPTLVDKYLQEEWDYVITVCDDARETCPLFSGKVKNRIHLSFEDPSHVQGSEEFKMSEFRRIRDSIKDTFYKFYISELKPIL